jgi:hypothetical protein
LEPDEPRGSRPYLRERRGEVPLRHSPPQKKENQYSVVKERKG